ncbi:MAG: hypothetical protein SPK34_07975 [Bacteroidaceae bacterium]|nr:hypothetical protein [Prevotellaceae bacterium]MDY5760853.1 hypothetical protein [Bacteroidaceae bacterium]
MKKSVLLFVSLLLATVSAIAQPAKPEVSYADWASVEEKTEIYFYNVEAGMFLTAGSSWGTRATLIGIKDKNTYNDLLADASGFKGNKWLIAAAEESRGGKNCYMFENKSGSNYLSADTKDGIWVDGGTDRPVVGWYIAKNNGDKTFQLGYMLKTEKKDAEGNTVKDGDNIVYEYSSMGIFGVQKFEEGDLNTYIDESEAYSTWAIVDGTEYERVQPLFQAYYAGISLQNFINEAKKQGINADFSPYEALLAKDGVTYKELQDAINKISPAVELGKAITKAKEFDGSRSWEKFEKIYANTESTVTELNDATALVNSLVALKTAINAGIDLDQAHDYSASTAIYNSDDSKKADVDTETTRVNAFVSLKKKLDEATAGYPAVDFSEAKTAYDNTQSDAKTLAEAEAKIGELQDAYDIAHATVDKPGDITSQLTNVDGSSATDWTRTWLGDGRAGDFHLNTWSVEGNNNADGTNMVVNFLEDWVAKGNTLSDQKFQRNPVKVAPGAYKITANIRVYNESGADYMKGAYLFGNVSRNSLFANEDEAQTNAVEGAKYNTYNNMLNYWKDGFETYAIVPKDGTLTFGVMIENANYNWVAAKNFRVYYMGDSYESLDYVRKNSDMFAQPFPEETFAMQQLLDDYNNAIPNYGKAQNAEELLDAVQKLVSLSESVQNNANAYKAYKDRVDGLKAGIENGEIDLDGPDADILFDYLDDLGEELGPDSETAVEYGFKNGYSAYIIANRLLKTEEITEELEFLNKLYDAAVRTSLKDGTDLTNLIVNPGFEEELVDGKGKGWSLDTSKGGTGSLTNWRGGDSDGKNYCAEAYEQNFDVYQEIEGVKDGIYEVSVQAFYRGGWPEAAWNNYKKDPEMKGDAKVYSEVYLNEFSTPIRNVMEITLDDVSQFTSKDNYSSFAVTGEGGETTNVFVPNGMASASTSFSLEDPEKNYTMSAYGLVTDGKIRLGIRRLTTPPSNAGTWTLWDNFKLTYRAKNPELAAQVLDAKAKELNELLTTSEENMTDPVIQNSVYAYTESQKTDLSDAAKYEVLIETNDAIVAAKENIQQVGAYKTANEAYQAACDELEKVDESQEAEIWNQIDEMDNELEGDAFRSLSTEDLVTLIAKVEDFTKEVQAAIDDIKLAQKVAEMADATDDKPYDATSWIINPDMEDASQDSNADASKKMAGWDFWKAKGNGPVKGSDGINGRSLEAWSGTIGAELEFTAYQTLTGLPAGKYKLSAKAANASNGVTADETLWADPEKAATGRAYLCAILSDGENEKAVSTPVEPNVGSATTANTYTVTFTVEEGNDVKIGFQSIGTMPFRWFMCDDFTLTYYGTESAKVDSTDEGDVVAIEGVEEAAPATKAIAGIYNASGAKIATLQQGINIVKYTDGSVKKIFVK